MADSTEERDEQPMRVDTALIRELAELVTANDLSEIEVEDGGRKIRVRRDPNPGPAIAAPVVPAIAIPAATAAGAVGSPDSAPSHAATADAVRSPMVGTVFLAPEPGAPPFVSVGQAVSAGDTLLIIEAMKVMNPIGAPRGGIVRQVLVSDAQPVEFDQPLLVIE